MRAIGLGHRMKALGGWDLVMMGSGSTRATGKENAAAWNTTTVGTTTTTGITAIMGTTGTIAIGIMKVTTIVGTIGTITTANPQQLSNRAPSG